jgi:hypothetical protein
MEAVFNGWAGELLPGEVFFVHANGQATGEFAYAKAQWLEDKYHARLPVVGREEAEELWVPVSEFFSQCTNCNCTS